MIFQLTQALPILQNTPVVLRDLLQNLDTGWIDANEGPQTWSAKEIVAHLIVCETTDWMVRTELILRNDASGEFTPIDMFAHIPMATQFTLHQLIEQFCALRHANIISLQQLNIQPIQYLSQAKHPVLGVVTLQQLLSAWVVHDLTHLSQITRVMAKLYVDEVGPFRQLLGILNK